MSVAKSVQHKPAKGLARLYVSRRIGGAPHDGRLVAGGRALPCALGRGGPLRNKREGDGGTPIGAWRLIYVFLRPGRFSRAGLRFPQRSSRACDLWCDDPATFLYNRPLRAPTRLGHERLWRDDRLYDFVGVLDYNVSPPRRGRGSAIFFHVATDDLAPTAGCVALRARDMARLAPRLARRVVVVVR